MASNRAGLSWIRRPWRNQWTDTWLPSSFFSPFWFSLSLLFSLLLREVISTAEEVYKFQVARALRLTGLSARQLNSMQWTGKAALAQPRDSLARISANRLKGQAGEVGGDQVKNAQWTDHLELLLFFLPRLITNSIIHYERWEDAWLEDWLHKESKGRAEDNCKEMWYVYECHSLKTSCLIMLLILRSRSYQQGRQWEGQILSIMFVRRKWHWHLKF